MLGLTIAQASAQQGGGIMGFLPMLAILLIAYLLILRPQMRRQKEHQKMLQSLDKGDKVVTTGGMHGEIVKINDKEGTIVLKVANDLRLTFDRGAVGRKVMDEVKREEQK